MASGLLPTDAVRASTYFRFGDRYERPCVNSPLWAGFECGHLGWCNQDLLQETRHTPTIDMTAHYNRALALGIRTARDGLPWRHVWGNPGTRRRWPCGWHGQTPEIRSLATVRTLAVGDYAVRASCCGCGHQVSLDLGSLIQTRYADVALDKLPFRCSACASRTVEFTLEDAI